MFKGEGELGRGDGERKERNKKNGDKAFINREGRGGGEIKKHQDISVQVQSPCGHYTNLNIYQ